MRIIPSSTKQIAALSLFRFLVSPEKLHSSVTSENLINYSFFLLYHMLLVLIKYLRSGFSFPIYKYGLKIQVTHKTLSSEL